VVLGGTRFRRVEGHRPRGAREAEAGVMAHLRAKLSSARLGLAAEKPGTVTGRRALSSRRSLTEDHDGGRAASPTLLGRYSIE
jgi:hypothetical protein